MSVQNIPGPDRKLELAGLLLDLVKDGLVSREDADSVLKKNTAGGLALHPIVVIADAGLSNLKPPHKHLTAEFLSAWLANRVKLPYLRIDPLKIDVASVTEVVSHAYASRFKILPVKVEPDRVVVATAEPYVREWEEVVNHVARRPITLVIANPVEINRYLGEFYTVSTSIKRATSDSGETAGSAGITNIEQLVELGKAENLDANDKHVVNIVDWLMQFAFDQRASDIHMEPRRTVGKIRFRIDGVMHQVYEMPTPVMTAVTSRIKALGRMDIVERRRPQDGRVKTKTPNGNEVELRLSTMPTAFGEKMVMRIFNPDVIVKGFAELGFSPQDEARWQGMTGHSNGIILVTGPTGSGKTTTLYSTLKHLARPEVNVCTVEDPIEMVEPNFNQMQVQHNIDLDFASGVRTLMRQDPDIIMVGEIRDLETAEMAVQAALTGHLVLSTLHTNDAASAITRLQELGIPAYLIKATLIGVVAQRLVRTLCPHCKEEAPLDRDLWTALVGDFPLKTPTKGFKPVGCHECRNTGYLGRVGLYEMLTITQPIRGFIGEQTDAQAIRRQAVKEGVLPLHIAGSKTVAEGLSTIDEVLKVAPHPDSN